MYSSLGDPIFTAKIVKYFIKAARIPIRPMDADIGTYLNMRLDGDTDPDEMSDGLWTDIMRVILEKISER